MESENRINDSATEPFHRVAKEDVNRLFRSMESLGTEAYSVYPVLGTILDWWTKNKDYRCSILAPEGGEDKGVCVIILEEYTSLRVLLYAPESETEQFIADLKVTNFINWNSIHHVARLTERLKDFVVEMLEQKGFTLYDGGWNYVMWMTAENASLLVENEVPENFNVRNLTEDDATTLVENWKFAGRVSDAVPLTRDSIRYNGGLGAEDKDGKLIAWVVWTHWGGLGQLYVYPEFRRLGLGRLLTVRIAKMISARGVPVTAEIETPNEASFKMFQKIGFRFDHLDIYVGLNHEA